MIRIVVADDHPIVLSGIQALISAERDMVIVGLASDGRAALRLAQAEVPDVMVLDMSMPYLSGIEVSRRLHEAGVACHVVALTAHEEPSYLRQLLALGMRGYVLKQSAGDSLVRAIRIVMAGGTYFDPLVASQMLAGMAGDRRGPARVETAELSPRELEVMKLAAQGHSNKVISSVLALGIKTVETYKARGMEKLGLSSRVELVRYARDHNWLAGDAPAVR